MSDNETASELKLLRMEIHTLGLEMRAGFAEMRESVATQSTRITTLTDAIADLRREYNGHSHPPVEGVSN
jgi:hypothetical protein